MKKISPRVVVLALLTLSLPACKHSQEKVQPAEGTNDTLAVADTGYTGIKQYMSNKLLIKEVTFRNGVREGLMKSFYPGGQLRQEFWYHNGLREDSSLWYYQEGQVFRVTPYRHDTIDGIQRQYYRTGKLKARIGYSNGFRTSYLEELSPEGKKTGNYPYIVHTANDRYNSDGTYHITLSLSDSKTTVRFHRGELRDEIFDTTLCKKLKTTEGRATVILKKGKKAGVGYLPIVAEIITPFGNAHLSSVKIALPYTDLN